MKSYFSFVLLGVLFVFCSCGKQDGFLRKDLTGRNYTAFDYYIEAADKSCNTGIIKGKSLEEMCENLQKRKLNRNCNEPARETKFNKDCGSVSRGKKFTPVD